MLLWKLHHPKPHCLSPSTNSLKNGGQAKDENHYLITPSYQYNKHFRATRNHPAFGQN